MTMHKFVYIVLSLYSNDCYNHATPGREPIKADMSLQAKIAECPNSKEALPTTKADITDKQPLSVIRHKA